MDCEFGVQSLESESVIVLALKSHGAVEDHVVRSAVEVNIVVAYALELQVVEWLACCKPLLGIGFHYVKAVRVDEVAHVINVYALLALLLAVGRNLVTGILHRP